MKRDSRFSILDARFSIKSFFTIYLLLIIGLCGCQNQRLYKDNRVIMGTFVEVTSPDKRAAAIAFGEIERIENLLSKYKPASEISRLNQFGKLKVSPETLYILKRAKEFSLISGGAFDITVGPLLDAWGFSGHKYRVPADEEIKKALKLIGSDKIILNETDNVVKLEIRGMKLDLGAIAKGYAVDCAVKKLREDGINSCLINAGGNIYCSGSKTDKGKPWKIAIQNPRQEGAVGYLELKDRAVATSGDYRQYFINRGKRYSHIFNPKTGYPVNSGIISVTVVAPDALTADALSTAIFVLGKEKAGELIKKFPDIKAQIIEEKDIKL